MTWWYCGRYVSTLCGLWYGVYPSPIGSLPRQYQGRNHSPWSHSHDPGASHSWTGGLPEARVDMEMAGYCSLWLVQLGRIPRTLSSLPGLTCPNPGASHARVLKQLDTRLVTLASRQQLHWGTWMVMWSPATKDYWPVTRPQWDKCSESFERSNVCVFGQVLQTEPMI